MFNKRLMKEERPVFPKRIIITAGMPYGNKNLHFGHVGGMFVHADIFARFLRDRIGKENVIFLSGTDCYGSPILESYRKLQESAWISSAHPRWEKRERFTDRYLPEYFRLCTKTDISKSFLFRSFMMRNWKCF